jgi:hypothetical protein
MSMGVDTMTNLNGHNNHIRSRMGAHVKNQESRIRIRIGIRISIVRTSISIVIIIRIRIRISIGKE